MFKKILFILSFTTVLISIKLSAIYEQLPGFPFSQHTLSNAANIQGGGVVNINDDPYLEIVISIGDTTTAINYQGERLWAAYTPQEVQSTMSFADIDNDGYLEILQSSRSGYIYIFDKDGNNFPGWPKYFGTPAPVWNYVISTPVAYDLNGDGNKEIIWGDFATNYQSNLFVVNLDGTNFNDNFPFPVPNGVVGTPAIGDVDSDGIPEIVVIDSYNVYVLKPDGSILEGWPQQPYDGEACYNWTPPVITDLTGDGYSEIVTVASGPIGPGPGTPSGIIVYKYDGTILYGWPQDFSYISFCPPTIADLNNDNELEILCGRNNLYIFEDTLTLNIYDKDGNSFSNSPYPGLFWVEGPIICGNIDETPEQEIIYDSNLLYRGSNTRDSIFSYIPEIHYNSEILYDSKCLYYRPNTRDSTFGYILGIHYNGEIISGFPLRPKGFSHSNSSVFGDINQDGLLDLITFTYDIYEEDSLWVYVYNLDHPYDPLEIEWKTYQYDFQRLGQYHPPFSFDPPLNLTGYADEHGVYISWSPPENGRNYAYNIIRNDEYLGEEFVKRIADTTFFDTEVESFTTYEYCVKSVYEQGYSPCSDTIEITTDSLEIQNQVENFNVRISCSPNPFTTSTTISFTSKNPLVENQQIEIFNMKGQKVKTLQIAPTSSRTVSAVWNGKNEQGKPVAQGVYFYKVETEAETLVKKMVKVGN